MAGLSVTGVYQLFTFDAMSQQLFENQEEKNKQCKANLFIGGVSILAH